MLIDFSELEKNKSFRSDMLYFIRMANPYIETIFWDVFSSNNKKQVLYAQVSETLKPKGSKDHGKHLLDCIVPDKNNNGKRAVVAMDCISGQFVNNVLNKLPNCREKSDNAQYNIVEGFEQKLRENYAIFGEHGKDNFTVFKDAISVLYKRRNFLEHYGEADEKKNGKSDTEKYNKRRSNEEDEYSDEKVINALGLFLLPELLAHFAGRVTSYKKKSKVQKLNQQAEFIREIIKNCVKNRRESNKYLFAEERSRKNIKDKQKRKHLVSDTVAWKKAYNEFRTDAGKATDYKLYEFKLRYHFIGVKNINKIRKILGEENSLHFKRDIEAFYILTAKVNLLIHRFFQIIPKSDDKMKAGDDELSEFLRKIRDTIAHNGLFWDVKKNNGLEAYSVEEVFIAVFRACYYIGGKNQVNDFYIQISSLLKKQKFALVDIKGEPPKYLHIKQWTEKNRKEYLKNNNDDVKIDKRHHYQQQVAKWKKSLDNAKKEIEIS